MLNRAVLSRLALAVALFALFALPGCTTVVNGQGSPVPDAVPDTNGPVRLAVPVLFRPATGIATPVSTDDCPADPLAQAQDSVSAPDMDSALCYPLGPAVVEVSAVADLRIVTEASGPTLRLTLLEDDEASFAAYSEANQGQQIALVTDGVVLTAPVIQAPISGPLVIVGDFRRAELEELIDTLVDG